MRRLEGRVAVVFGGSRGIGAKIAQRLGRDGADVLVTYRDNGARAEDVVSATRAEGARAEAVRADVGDPAAVRIAFDCAAGAFGRIDDVINVAGVPIVGPIAEVSDGAFAEALAVNMLGPFQVMREAAKRVADGGAIIQFSSGAAANPFPGNGVYGAMRVAGERLAASLAKELGHRGVRVNVVAPGLTRTEGLHMPESAIAAFVAQTALGRVGEPDEVADAVAMLLSRDARWITGQVIRVNGGLF